VNISLWDIGKQYYVIIVYLVYLYQFCITCTNSSARTFCAVATGSASSGDSAGDAYKEYITVA
jgi:hypothetical protein